MKIENKNRIRNSKKYTSHILDGENAYIGLSITNEIETRLKEIGFKNLTPNESLVPAPNFGPFSKFNANGKDLPQKDKPKENLYRQHYFTWQDFQGNSHSRIVDIPYQRYERKWDPAPCIELTIVNSGENKFVIAGNMITMGQTEEISILHRINLLLGIFKQAEIFQENLNHHDIPKIIKLSWNILPQGNMPWESFKVQLEPLFKQKSNGKTIILTERLETIYQYTPDFQAIGTNGYQGYIIFGFTNKNLYIFENAEYGNATYIFEASWEQLSKMTKAEILSSNLQKHRFIHVNGWKQQIQNLFLEFND